MPKLTFNPCYKYFNNHLIHSAHKIIIIQHNNIKHYNAMIKIKYCITYIKK